ncbi:MAG: STN domain-containing protein, partial [Pseudomonas sp.]
MNNTKFSLRSTARFRWLPLALALAVSSGIASSYADEAVTRIEIQAQPLASALSQLGQQTSLQLFFSPELVAGKQAPAVSGNLAPEQALQTLLQGSGLTYELSQGTVVL